MSNWSKYEDKQKELKKLNEKHEKEMKKLTDKRDKEYAKLSEEQIAFLSKEKKQEEKCENRFTSSIVLGVFFAIGVFCLIAFTDLVKNFNGGTIIALISSASGLAMFLIFYCLIFRVPAQKIKLKELKNNPLISNYVSIVDEINKVTKEYEYKKETLEKEAENYLTAHNSEDFVKAFDKVASFIGSMASSSPDSEYTHQIKEDGYIRDLKKTGSGDGYDSVNGWHDTYKDDLGRSWGTTDDGKTFFKKD